MYSKYFQIRSTLIAALVAATPASAANLLSNGEFSNFTLSPWTPSQGQAFLSNLDHANDLDSGSALLVDNTGSFIAVSLLSECVRIQGGAQADASTYVKGGSRVPANSKTRIGRSFYSDANCGGSSFISSSNSGFTAVPANWSRISNLGAAPANAQSIRIDIVATSGDNSAFDLLIDGVVLDSAAEGSPAVLFTSTFESGNLTGWSAVQ